MKTKNVKKVLRIAFSGMAILSVFQSYSQDVWKTSGRQISRLESGVLPKSVVQVNFKELSKKLTFTNKSNPEAFLELPMPSGDLKTFRFVINTTMHPALAKKYPTIKAMTGTATDGSGIVVKAELAGTDFHAMYFVPGDENLFLDPLNFDINASEYMLYVKSDAIAQKSMTCGLLTGIEERKEAVTEKRYGSCELRTYRLAISATAEYTAFQGGTVEKALAAQVTTMNRVNGIYERDLAITMELVANNDTLIFTNASSDPFTNGNTNQMIGANPTVINARIGVNNYDIGHVFGTNSGGLASLASVCRSNKAGGVTGSGAPKGDPFDVDYVAHEMGHQFGGNHTQNNDCNKNNFTAVEPGSGSTIMGYAGICPPNVQNNSDDHFHGISLGEIGAVITSAGHTCPVKTPLDNSAPSVSIANTTVNVPANTPFALKAIATDADGDALTYCWEQTDNQITTQPPLATATGGPNFRSNKPTLDSVRYLPSIKALLSTATNATQWEKIPSVNRTMNFRVSVRDNHAGGGCTDHKNTIVKTVASAGPFVVKYPTASGIVWPAKGKRTVTWDVANTNSAPILADKVDIRLSIDGGTTFTTVLANTANDGTEEITVPDVATTKALVMVINSGYTFFDVSRNVFTIDNSSCTPPDLPLTLEKVSVCKDDSVKLEVTGGELNAATTYKWYSGSCGGTLIGEGKSIYVKSAGFYYVRGEGGCVNSGNCRRINVQGISGFTPTISVKNGELVTDVTRKGTYQWLDCGTNMPVPNATDSVFVPTQNGQYTVRFTETSTTCKSTAPCLTYNFVGLQKNETGLVRVFPNPSNGIVHLELKANNSVEKLNVIDAQGRIVAVPVKKLNDAMFELDLTNESKGLYWIELSTTGGIERIEVIKQ